ncbi:MULTISPECIES: hypothetical protein [Rosenbergiella]|uniref:hypothetical protein n=1 Tax=Rosenbergiella TaxID=1356488 RepID=UPI001F4F7982|nr:MULTISPECIES: hypothetical protein [Rosenbergiella]
MSSVDNFGNGESNLNNLSAGHLHRAQHVAFAAIGVGGMSSPLTSSHGKEK